MRRSRSQTRVGATMVVAVLLVACGGGGDPAEPDPANGDPAADGAADDAEGANAADDAEQTGSEVGDLDQQIAQARVLLEGTDGGDSEVVLAERVTWPDASLGCPQPDQVYTQALVEGYRIVLAADGEEVAYHGADGAAPFRCDDPAAPID